MYSDSRKAQRNSFAHHRAQLLFSRHEAQASDVMEWAASIHEGTEGEDRSAIPPWTVSAGLIGYSPAAVVTC